MKPTYFAFGACLSILLLAGCASKLDLTPVNATSAASIYSTPDGYLRGLAKVYGCMANTGNTLDGSGNPTDPDLPGAKDQGFTDFFRELWNTQELTTDEAVVAWSDPGLQDFHNLNYASGNQFLYNFYRRSLFQIAMANDFIGQANPSTLAAHGIAAADTASINTMRNEARFLRAYQYWVLLDGFRNPPFVTENSTIGKQPQPQTNAKDLFVYIEKELLDVQNRLPAPKMNDYARADQAAVWALLARLYLNAEVYVGTARWADAATYAKKVIDAGYSLIPDYRKLFRADNDLYTRNEIILPIAYDGLHTKTYGGSTFLIFGALGGDMIPKRSGVLGSGWGGIRTTKALLSLFADSGTGRGNLDRRAQFVKKGQTYEITDLTVFRNGYGVNKFKNLLSDSSGRGKDPKGTFADTDVPLFRISEMYLLYAECALRDPASADVNLALGYINAIRNRAYAGNVSGQILPTDLTLQFILDERARELYWEGHRRTDLIRFGKFLSGYNWPWKGGVADGKDVDAKYLIFPIPSNDLNANPTLKQNPGF